MSSHMNQFIIVQREGKVIQTLPLTMAVLRIGRTPEDGLPLNDKLVSRNHAQLRMEPHGVLLTDLGSSNGTYLDTQRLPANQPHLLYDGATFHIGPFAITYHLSKAVTSPPPTQKDVMRPVQELPTLVTIPAIPDSPTIVMQQPQPASVIGRRPLAEPDEVDCKHSMYRQYLPDIFQENDFLMRFLHIFEDIWEPLEQRQDHIAMYFDPRTCPASFLPWLASWLDIPLTLHEPKDEVEKRHRNLLMNAVDLYSAQGTSAGLADMINVCTGLTAQITEHPSQPFVFTIRIILPPGASGEMLDKDLIEELIQAHKPAHAGYVLEFTI